MNRLVAIDQLHRHGQRPEPATAVFYDTESGELTHLAYEEIAAHAARQLKLIPREELAKAFAAMEALS